MTQTRKPRKNRFKNKTKRSVRLGGASSFTDTKYSTTMIRSSNPSAKPEPSSMKTYESVCREISNQTNTFSENYFANSRLPASLFQISQYK
jgi:hypothetical protein